jgi:peptide/nickel transport system substrate-binding protein
MKLVKNLFVLFLLCWTIALAQDNELVVGLQGDIIAVDPAFTYDFTTSTVVNQITEGLLKFNNGETLEPNLAESWENPDPLTYIYNIRQGVTFQDGTPMTVDDVIFSMERTRNADTGSYVGWMYSNVDTIEQTSDWQITVKLTQPDALWQYVPATTGGHVISKAHFEANAENFGKPEAGAIGTGPYKFVSWATGSEVIIEKNADYWNSANGGPYLDRVTYKILPEATTRVAGLQTGEIDLVIGTDGAPADQLPIIQGMDNVTLTFTDSYYSNFLAFNTQRPPFDNAKVRQALNYAMDKKLLMQNLYPIADAVTVAKAVDVMPRLWTFEQEKWQAAYDQLNGMVITTDENPLSLGMALALQAAAAELGYQLEINKVTYQENITLAFGGARDYDIIATAWGSDFPDPAGNLLPVFHSRYVGDGGSNFGNYVNAEVDKLLDEQNALTDTAARTDLMVQAQQLIADDSAWIVVMHPKQVFVLANEFEGYTVTPLWYWDAFVKDIKMK